MWNAGTTMGCRWASSNTSLSTASLVLVNTRLKYSFSHAFYASAPPAARTISSITFFTAW